MRIVTIGGYGFDQHRFIEALSAADVDTFIDIRQRRGVRGARYSFPNSKKLQAVLATAGIDYIYLRELAPTQAVREVQKKRDAQSGILKRARSSLSDEFIEAYKTEILDNFDVAVFQAALGENAKVVAFFCVEGPPEACHRSLVAEKLGRNLSISVEHIRP